MCVVRVLVSGQGACFCQHTCVWEYGPSCVSRCQCVSRQAPLSHADVTEFVRVSASVTVCVNDVSACVHVGVCVSVSVRRRAYVGYVRRGTDVCVCQGVCQFMPVEQGVWCRVPKSPRICVRTLASVCACLSVSAWVAPGGEAPPGRCGCTLACAAVRMCLFLSSWAAVCGEAPPGQCGGVRPGAGRGALPLSRPSATCGAQGASLWGGASPGPQAPVRA